MSALLDACPALWVSADLIHGNGSYRNASPPPKVITGTGGVCTHDTMRLPPRSHLDYHGAVAPVVELGFIRRGSPSSPASAPAVCRRGTLGLRDVTRAAAVPGPADIIAILGMDELSEEDKLLSTTGGSAFVTTQFCGEESPDGRPICAEDTIRSFKALLAGNRPLSDHLSVLRVH